jgi:hypothetical protein
MRLTDGIKHKGKPFEIPDVSRDDLPEFFVDMGYKVGAEVGVYKGEYSRKICEVGLKLYAIDPWRIYKDFKHQRGQSRLDFQYEHTKRVLAPYPKSTIIRKTSMEAVEEFEDNSLDFVYIDGHHGFKYVAEDLCEWSKKVKKGGIVSGHDYTLNKKPPRDPHVLQVKYVLHAFVEAFEIKDFFVLGRRRPEGERIKNYQGKYYDVFVDGEKKEKRDRWRSWMFVKP